MLRLRSSICSMDVRKLGVSSVSCAMIPVSLFEDVSLFKEANLSIKFSLSVPFSRIVSASGFVSAEAEVIDNRSKSPATTDRHTNLYPVSYTHLRAHET